MNTSVTIAGVTLKNPVMTASGTFGSGMEYSDFVDLNRLGAVVTKGVSNVPWKGNPTPRVAEVYGGMLNAIGLQNPGIDVFMERDLPFLDQYDTVKIVNVCGKTVEDYLEVVERLQDSSADMLEINVSCPNVKEGAIAFGQKADSLFDITSRIRKVSQKPIIMKLSPNVTDITEMARAAEAAGSDAISLINTITGMKIDIHRRKFVLANKTGGMSGPAIKPVAVRMVYQASHAGVKIDILVRGNCSLKISTNNYTKNIRCIGIIDRYLEHSRILIFCNGGHNRYYLGSADWMPRNLTHRIEVMTPVYDENLQADLLRTIEYGLRDTTNGCIIDGRGTNKFQQGEPFRSQEKLYEAYHKENQEEI